jgi:histidyl-tRNA synthetase
MSEPERPTQSGPRLAAPRGTVDLMPEVVPRWRAVEAVAHDLFARYGFQELRTPLLEYTPLFVRSIGEVTDIVEKEMYTFGEGEDSVTLRPEGTASAVRAYLEHNYHKQAPFQKWYYLGPMFRRERPQAGRQRQFHQIGVEVLGSADPLLDVEVMTLAMRFFAAIGLTGASLHVNTIGCLTCRAAYREVLKRELGKVRAALCPNCQGRFERNIFRVLDCKEPGCRRLCDTLPPMTDHLDDACGEHWTAVVGGLARAGVPHVVDHRLVRGFDYYTRTVFEVKHSALGARDAILGGGRYDNLIADLGGPSLGALGFAVGTEATLLAAEKVGALGAAAATPRVALYVAAITPAERPAAYTLIAACRDAGLAADMDHEGKSPRAQMRAANALGAPVVAILGPDEAGRGEVKVKHMRTGEEITVAQPELAAAVARFLAADDPNLATR